METPTAPTRPLTTIEDDRTDAAALVKQEPEIEHPRQEPRRPQVVGAAQTTAATRQPDVATSVVVFSEQVDQIFAAMAEAQKGFGTVDRSQEAVTPKYSYDYAPLSEYIDAVRPKLSENGIAVMQFPFTTPGKIIVRTYLGHKSGQWMYNDLSLAMGMNDPQAIGSALTYLRKYALQSIAFVAAGYDDDGAAASTPAEGGGPKPTPRRSETRQAEAAPAPQGRIKDLDEKANGVVVVELETGFIAGTRDPELIKALKTYKNTNAKIELSTIPPSDPRFAPKIEEVALMNGATRA